MAGAGGGLLSYFVGEISGGWMDNPQGISSLVDLFIGSALWSGSIGLTIGAAILIYDNLSSLRGQWHRDLLGGLPLFFSLSFLGGLAGQLAYSIMPNSLTRGIGWSLMGASIGIGIGVLRRDITQAGRGALGGAIGGFLGGFIFDGLTLISSAGNGSLSRLVGQILMGALIALLMRVVQEALKSAWLLGISTGSYEGKEYPLNTARVTVGRDDSNAIALYREAELPAKMGALVFENQSWKWQGAPILINGTMQSDAALNPGDTLQLAQTRFRFLNRSVKSAANESHFSPAAMPPSAPYAAPLGQTNLPPTVVVPPAVATPPAATVPVVIPSFALMALSGQLLRLPDLSSPVSVGRVEGNRLVLADEGVSSRHAAFHLERGVLYVTDVGSTNGTFVNGVKLAAQTPQPLRIGERVKFGRLEYSLRAG